VPRDSISELFNRRRSQWRQRVPKGFRTNVDRKKGSWQRGQLQPPRAQLNLNHCTTAPSMHVAPTKPIRFMVRR
jgi:hypothetical protein